MERRQAFRRDAVEVELAPGEFFLVEPIPWEQRNDFANEIVRQHVEILNESVRLYTDPDTGLPQLEAKAAQKFSDPVALFKLGLSEEAYKKLSALTLYYNQVVEILLAIADVNDLDQVKPMLDPNSLTPTKLSGTISSLLESGTDSQSDESGQDSSSTESEETPSGVSLIQNSSPS